MPAEPRPIRVLIVDDEPLARRGLALRLADEDDIEIVAEAGSGRDALRCIEDACPDVLFLDIQMPGMTGLQLLAVLQRDLDEERLPLVVFVTAYDDYAVRAFEAQALDYLLKPLDPERLSQALARVRRRLRQRDRDGQHERLRALIEQLRTDDPARAATLEDAALERLLPSPRLVFRDGHKTLRLRQADIRWIEAAGDYMCVHTGEATHVVRATMKGIEARADPAVLQRVHRSTIVNVNAVRSLSPYQNGEYLLTLDCGKQIKLSRHYRDKLALLQSA
jgi:two-component system LytT family response regulator